MNPWELSVLGLYCMQYKQPMREQMTCRLSGAKRVDGKRVTMKRVNVKRVIFLWDPQVRNSLALNCNYFLTH